MKIKNVVVSLLIVLITIGMSNISTFAVSSKKVTPDISAGSGFTISLKEDGTVWTWGDNDYGQLGDGTNLQRDRPVQVEGLKDIVAISAGRNHSMALKEDGTVWAWGNNCYGQLGDGTTVRKNIPIQTNLSSDITAISAGDGYSMAIKSDGTVMSWGDNGWGQLGDGTEEGKITPVQVKELSDVTAISAGYLHAMALKSDGTVKSWGRNHCGELGDGTEVEKNIPVQVKELSNVTAISAGTFYSIALDSNGALWGWGKNYLGDGTKNSSNIPVKSNVENINAIETACGQTLAIKTDGSVWKWGSGKLSEQIDGLIDVKNIAITKFGSSLHSVVLKADNTVWGWGNNQKGQLGDGSKIDKYEPVRANNLPKGGNSTVVTNEDTVYIFETDDFEYSDVNDDDLKEIKITGVESKGSLQVNDIDVAIEQSITIADIENSKLKYIPQENDTETVSFQFKVNDGVEDSTDIYTMTINIIPIDDAPTDISLDSNSVKENESIGTVVGVLSAIDPDVGDTTTFTLVSGTGDTDNNCFTIEGTNLKTAKRFDYETKTSYNIRVRATDSTDKNYEESFTIEIENVLAEVNAETPVITNNITNQTGTVNDVISLNATATVSDKGTISYQWFEVANMTKEDPKLMCESAVYEVDTSDGGTRYYYCKVTNTNKNTNVNGQQIVSIDSNVVKITITSINHIPQRKTGVPDSEDFTITFGDIFTLDLSSKFVDPDDDELTFYYIKTIGGIVENSSTDKNFSYTPTELNQVTFLFNAFDSSELSTDKYQVNLMVEPIEITGYDPIANLDAGVVDNLIYEDAAEVANALPNRATISGTTHAVIIAEWKDVDNYRNEEGSYTFTAQTINLPFGYVDNDKNEINVEVVVKDSATTEYTVTFKDWDGSILKTETVEQGKSATAPPQPTRDGYTFTNWDNDFTDVQSDMTVTAQYSKNVVSPNSIASYSPVTFTQTGDIAHNNVQYQTGSEVINALQTNITVTLGDSSTRSIPISWSDIDGYNSKVAGYYTFKATWGVLPSGVNNDNNIVAPSCEVKVAKGNSGEGSSSYTPREKTPTEKAYSKIKKAKPNEDGIARVNIEAKTSWRGKTTFRLPTNFLENEMPIELTIENKNVHVTLLNSMFTGEEKRVELIIQPTKKEELGLSEEEREEIGDLPVYNICLKIDGKEVDWKGEEDIVITIKLDDEENKEEHRFVAVYYDGNGNVQILRSSYYKNGKLHLKTKHLSDYGVIYVEPTFKDIEEHWANEAIEALSARGIIKGVKKDEFRPEEAISRADLVTLMIRMFGFTSDNSDEFTSDSEKVFEDVDSSEYYAKPIMIAKELGLVKGYSDNTFKPLESVSRQDMMVLLQRAIEISQEYPNIKSNGKSYLNCSDSDEILSYAIESVELMINSEIVKTRLEKICPKVNATRAEVADALYNIIKTNMK